MAKAKSKKKPVKETVRIREPKTPESLETVRERQKNHNLNLRRR